MAHFRVQIVRRFPELERFTDAERLAFVRETRRGWLFARLVRLLMPWFLGVLVAVMLFAAVWRAMTWGLQAKTLDAASDVWMILCAVSYAAPVALGFVVWSAMRRRLLWRRVKEALGDGWVPGATPLPNRTPVNPGTRCRYAVELVTMLLVTAAPFAAVGGAWWMICAESRRAREIKPGAAALNKLIATLPPAAGKPGEFNVWLDFPALWRKVDQVEESVWKEMGSPIYGNGNRLSPAYVNIGLDPARVSDERRAEFVLEQQMAERMLPALKAAGVFDSARKIVGNSNMDVGVPSFTNDQAIALLPRPGVRDTFNSLKFNVGRMAAAVKSDDVAEFSEAFRVFTAAARVFEREPFPMSRAYEISIDALANGMILRGLMSNTDERWLRVVGPLLEEGRPRVPVAYMLEAARLTEIDSVCYEFAEPMRVAKWRAELLYTWFKEGKDRRLGTLDENLRSIDTHFAAMTADLSKPRMDRSNRSASPKAGLLFENIWRNPYWSLVSSADRNEVDRRGLTIVCAVERYKLANGRYPTALADLVPGQLAALPPDPWSGRPFSYKRVDPSSDPHGRSFLVYIWGNDGIDNGGTSSRPYYNAVAPGAIPDIDYVINTPHDQ